MLYMLELRYSTDTRDEALRYFQEHGVTHYEGGVEVQGLWVATRDHVAYVLVQSEDSGHLDQACGPLARFGTLTRRLVTDSEQI